jgi:hypothetical protein
LLLPELELLLVGRQMLRLLEALSSPAVQLELLWHLHWLLGGQMIEPLALAHLVQQH